MDFETAVELIADRHGTVDWGLVQEAVEWVKTNQMVDEALKEIARLEQGGTDG